MPWFYLAFGLLGALVAWAVYLFLRRAVRAFGAEVKSLKIKLILWASAVAVGIASLAFQRFSVPILFHFFLFALLLQFGNFLFKKLVHKHYENRFAVWKKIYALSLIPLLLTAVVLFCGYINLHTVVATRYTVYTEKSLREEGYRAVYISDVHYGVSLDRAELQKVCDEIEA